MFFSLNPESALALSVDRARAFSERLAQLQKDDDEDVEAFVPIYVLQKDAANGAEKRLVYGEVLIPEKWDNQQDIISEDEIEKAAHGFLEEYQNLGFNHKGKLDKSAARIVESYIAPVDMQLGGRSVKKGTWVLVTKVYSDALWDAIKKGDINGYSVGGQSRWVAADDEFANRSAP
jgi:hypothetical protein